MRTAKWTDFSGIQRSLDLKKVNRKLLKTQNFYPKKPGAISRRPGSDFVTLEDASIDDIIAIYPFYREQWGRFFTAYCHMNSISDPTINTLTLTPGTGGNLTASKEYRVYYGWVGGGGETLTVLGGTVESADMAGKNSIAVTLPAFPTGARTANIYIENVTDYSGEVIWAGSTETTSFNILTMIDLVSHPATPTIDAVYATTGGSLEPGIYHVGAVSYTDDSTSMQNYQPVAIGNVVVDSLSNAVEIQLSGLDTNLTCVAITFGTQYDYQYFHGIYQKPTGQTDLDITITELKKNVNVSYRNVNNAGAVQRRLYHPTQRDALSGFTNNTGSGALIVFNEKGEISHEIMMNRMQPVYSGYFQDVDVESDASTVTVMSKETHGRFTTVLDRMFFTNNKDAVLKSDGYVLRGIGRLLDGNIWVSSSQFVISGKYIKGFNNALVVGGGLAGDQFTYFSLPGDPDIFTRDRGATQINAFVVSTDKGDEITGFGVASSSSAGEGPASGLLIAKTASMHFQAILPLISGSATPKRMLDKLDGCSADRTIVNTPVGTIYVGRSNVFIVGGDGSVAPIGMDIESIIKRVELTRKPLMHATYNRGFYKLFIPMESSTTCETQYWLDLRNLAFENGQPVRMKWWGPMTGVSSKEVVTRDGQDDNNDRIGLCSLSDVISDSLATGVSGNAYIESEAGQSFDSAIVAGTIIKFIDNSGSQVTKTVTVRSTVATRTRLEFSGALSNDVTASLLIYQNGNTDRLMILDIEAENNFYYTHPSTVSASSGDTELTGTDLDFRLKVGMQIRITDDDSNTVERILTSVTSTTIGFDVGLPGDVTAATLTFCHNYGYFYDLGADVQSLIRTGDIDFNDPTVQKRIYSVFAAIMSEEEKAVTMEIRKNREQESRYTAVNIPVSATADRWNEDYWNGDDLADTGGLVKRSGYFGSNVQLLESMTLMIRCTGNKDILITDFGVSYELEKRKIVRS